METARRRAALVLAEKHGTNRDTDKPEYDLYRIFSFRVHAWSGTRVPDPPVYVCRSRGPPNYVSASLAE
jgi:hypothetical protein